MSFPKKHFIGVVVVFHILQYFLFQANYPSYIVVSLDALEKLFGRSSIYSTEGWYSFAHGWVYLIIFLFWIGVWCLLAKILERVFK